MPSKEIDRRAAYKKNKNLMKILGEKKLPFDPVALGIITKSDTKKKKTGGVAKKMNMGGVKTVP